MEQDFESNRTTMEDDCERDLQQIRVETRKDLMDENDKNSEAKGNLKLMKKKHQKI
jgi:hypothetical protein